MQLTLWTYEGPPHVGAMRVASAMEGLHYVLHAPQGDTYADLLFTMIERRDTFEYFRDAAADQFKVHAKKPWLPRSGSKVNRKALTASVVSSRDFQKAFGSPPSGVLRQGRLNLN